MPLRRIHPDVRMLTPDEAIAGLDLAALALAGRPYVIANMVASADGKATVDGKSGGLGSPTDRAIFHRLRSQADCVLAGAGTLRAERYGRLVRDPAVRAQRAAEGLAPDAVAATITRTLQLGDDLPLLADPDSTLIVFTSSDAAAPAGAARIVVERMAPSELGAAAALRRLRARHGIRSVLCEGGPALLGELVADGVLDELFLSVSPLLAGGAEVRTIVEGPALAKPARLSLVWALEADSGLYLRYRVAR
jgi:riboflavin biosynthesis pyrimidine reductase